MVMLRAFGATSVNINTGEAAVKSLPRDAAEPPTLSDRWPRCGGRMIIIEDLRTRRDAGHLGDRRRLHRLRLSRVGALNSSNGWFHIELSVRYMS